MFWGPSQLPRDDTWMVGPVLRASQLPTDQSLGLKCQWPEMAAAAGWKGPQVKRRLPLPMLCHGTIQVVKQPMQPGDLRQADGCENTFTQFYLMFCAYLEVMYIISIELKFLEEFASTSCFFCETYVSNVKVGPSSSEKTIIETSGTRDPQRVCFIYTFSKKRELGSLNNKKKLKQN